jgi:hypothetical protein
VSKAVARRRIATFGESTTKVLGAFSGLQLYFPQVNFVQGAKTGFDLVEEASALV